MKGSRFDSSIVEVSRAGFLGIQVETKFLRCDEFHFTRFKLAEDFAKLLQLVDIV